MSAGKMGGVLLVLAAAVVTTVVMLQRRGDETNTAGNSTSPSGASAQAQSSPGRGESISSTHSTNVSPAQSRSEDFILAKLAALELDRDPHRQSIALTKIAESISIAEIPNVLSSTLAKSGRLYSELKNILLRRWVKNDAPLAAAWLARNARGAKAADLYGLLAGVWAEQDAAGATQWTQQLPAGEERNAATLGLATELADANPVAALSLAVELPPGERRDEFLQQAAAEWAAKDAAAAIEWGKKIEDEVLRVQLLAAVVNGIAESDPRVAANLAAQALPPGRAQDDAVVSTVQHWVQDQPKDAAAWVTSFPEGNLRATAMEALVKLWADQDLAAAGEWVTSLKNSDADFALGVYVQKLAVEQPEAAVQLAGQIQNARTRDARLAQVAELWLRSDANAARDWISKSSLPADTKNRLLAPNQ